MSKLYATIEGNRNPKTCQGFREIKAATQSYHGSVITRLDYHNGYDNPPRLTIDVALGTSTACGGKTVFSGTMEEFIDLCENYKALKEITSGKYMVDTKTGITVGLGD